MPFALGLKSVNASAGAIVSLWDRLSVLEDSPSMRALNHPPHITFAIYDAPEVTRVIAIAAMERTARGRTAIAITFNRIRTFDGPSLILWARAKGSPARDAPEHSFRDQPGILQASLQAGKLGAALHARDAHHSLQKRGRAGVCDGISRQYPRHLRCRRLRRARAIEGRCRGAAQRAGNLAHADYGFGMPAQPSKKASKEMSNIAFRRSSLNRLTCGLAALALVLALALSTGAASADTADTVLFNGKILTVDNEFSVQEALAIGHGRVLASGTSAAMKNFAGDTTRLIDLGGRTVIPGLTDGHIHGIRAALTFGTEVNWIGVPSLKEALEKVRQAGKVQKPGSWIVVAGGWTEEQFAEKRRPSPQEVAEAAPDNPV
jgi:hypothetical protein